MKGKIFAICLSLLLLTACKSAKSGREDEALVPQVYGAGAKSTGTKKYVNIFTAEIIKVRKRATLVSVDPRVRSPEVDVLATRVQFLVSKSRRTHNSYPAAECTTRWPPKGLGSTYAVENLEVAPGESFFVIFYVRSREVGSWGVEGVRITYRDSTGDTRRIESNRGARIDIVTVEDDSHLPKLHCEPEDDSAWTA